MGTLGKYLLGGVLLALLLYWALRRETEPAHTSSPVTRITRNSSGDSARPVPLHPPRAGTRRSTSEARGETSGLQTKFHRLQRCYLNLLQISASKSRADCTVYEGKPEDQDSYAACLNGSLDEQNAIQADQEDMAGCPSDGEAILKEYYVETKAAARAGDPDAQICYVDASFSDTRGRPRFVSQADVDEYKTVAPQYVSDALHRGDWRIVDLLSTHDLEPNTRGLLTYLDHIGDPETVYRMDKLLRLGATGEYAASLDAMLQEDLARLKEKGSDATSAADKAAEGDRWARETYNQYFAGQPPLTDPPGSCSM